MSDFPDSPDSSQSLDLPSICEEQIPDLIYKVIYEINPNNPEVYVFVGKVSLGIQTILTKLESNPDSLTDSDNISLSQQFGPDFQNVLGLNLKFNKIKYLNFLIEVDDNITNIKNKICVYLKIPVEWQYLYSKIYIESDQPDDKVESLSMEEAADEPAMKITDMALGHAFVTKDDEPKLIQFPKNPFKDIDLAHESINYFIEPSTGTKSANYDKNDTQGTLITEYPIINRDIYLVNICPFLQFVRQEKGSYTGVNLTKFKFGYVCKYWPNLILDYETQFNSLYEVCSSSNLNLVSQQEKFLPPKQYEELTNRVQRDTYLINLIKNPPSEIKDAKIDFKPCVLLEIVLQINYQANDLDFIDLMKIYTRYVLSEAVPFAKYKGEKAKEPRHKLYAPIIDINPIETIQDWVSTVQKKQKEEVVSKGNDAYEYRVSSKGLSFKRFLYKNSKGENKYSTINLFKNGKIELKCFWEEAQGADLMDVSLALKDLADLINEINEIEYQLPGLRKLRITPPNLDLLDRLKKSTLSNSNGNILLGGNVQIGFMNTATQFDYGDIMGNDGSYDQISRFATCFNTFISVIPRGLSYVYDAVSGKMIYKQVMTTALQMRYKRISNYMNLSTVNKYIYDISQQTVGIEKITIIKLLANRFNISEDYAQKIYLSYEKNQADKKDYALAKKKNQTDDKKKEPRTFEKFTNLDYVLGKKISKQPGVDIKIQGQNEKSKIFVLGAKSLFQLSMIHRFLRNLLKLFKKIEIMSKDATFKSYTKPGECEIPENFIMEGVQQGIEEGIKITNNKNLSQIAKDIPISMDDVSGDLLAQILSGDYEDEDEILEENLNDELAELPSGDDDGESPKLKVSLKNSGESEAEPSPKTKTVTKKIVAFDYSKPIKPLDRLQAADPEAYKVKQYSVTCQANVFKQPMVIPEDLYQQKHAELTNELKKNQEQVTTLNQTKPVGYQQQIQALDLARARIEYKLATYSRGVSYRNHFYFCPKAYEYETERILSPEEFDPVTKTDKLTQNPIYWYNPPKDKAANLDYVGFAKDNVRGDQNVCQACCFAKPKMRFGECLTGIQVETKAVSGNSLRYILAAGIQVGRFGMLPETLNIIFNKGVKSESKIQAGYDHYLRKGIAAKPKTDIFLSAIGETLTPPMDGASLRKLIINKLNLKTFLTLKSGGLRLVFNDDNLDYTDQNSFEEFVNFIETENNINEDMLWDFLTMPGILLPSGLNLFIFESQGAKGRYSDPVVLKCPLGYNVHDLYSYDRPSIVLFKYGEKYEPIFRVMDSGPALKIIEMLPPNHPLLKGTHGLISYLDQCAPSKDEQAYKNEADFFKKTNQIPPKFEEQTTLKQTVDRLIKLNAETLAGQVGGGGDVESTIPSGSVKLKIKSKPKSEFAPIGQIIDNYNKAIYVVLENRFKLPIKPSSRHNTLPVMDYPSIPALSYENSVRILNHLAQSTNLPVKPVGTTNNTQGLINGLTLSNGLTVETLPMSVDDYNNLDNKTKIKPIQKQYYDSRFVVDQAIEQSDKISQVDDRSKYINLRKFEDETYQRLRYEVSKVLQQPDRVETLNQIQEILEEKETPISQRRIQLHEIIEPIVQGIIVTQRTHEFNYDDYQIPNVRTSCGKLSATACIENPHCDLDQDQCKLFVEPRNLLDQQKNNSQRYISLIVEELLKNPLNRIELLTDQVDNAVDPNVFEFQPNEIVLNEGKYTDIKKRLEQYYKNKMAVNYQERIQKLYDVANPVNYSDNGLQDLLLDNLKQSSCQQGFETLTVYWRGIIGDQFRRLINDSSTNCIYHGLSLALNQKDGTDSGAVDEAHVHTIQSIRAKVAQSIPKLMDEPANPNHPSRPGWQLLNDHLRFIFKDQIKDVATQSELMDFMASDYHRLSLIDLIMMSQIYDVKFILMYRKRPALNPSGFKCLGSTTSLSDNYILIYKVGWEDYQLIADISHSPPKYVFKNKELPTKLYQLWQEVCGATDSKNIKDSSIPLLFKAPLYKDLLVSPAYQAPVPTTPKAKMKISFKPKITTGTASSADLVEEQKEPDDLEEDENFDNLEEPESEPEPEPEPEPTSNKNKPKVSLKSNTAITSKGKFLDPMTGEVLEEQNSKKLAVKIKKPDPLKEKVLEILTKLKPKVSLIKK